MRYRVQGTMRQVGAIGIMEPFAVEVDAGDADGAATIAREQLYAAHYEHVLIHSVTEVQP